MSEKVARFVGGPLDGKTQVLRVDLETVEFVDRPETPIVERPGVPSKEEMKTARVFYRRSLRSTDIYVFQP